MAENQNCESKARIPAGWERRGEGYYCRETEQEFKTLDALLGYVTYAKVFQPELFDSWSEKKAPCRKKKGRTTEETEGVSFRGRKLNENCQMRKGASSSNSPIDAKGGEEQSTKNLCLGGCQQGKSVSWKI